MGANKELLLQFMKNPQNLQSMGGDAWNRQLQSYQQLAQKEAEGEDAARQAEAAAAEQRKQQEAAQKAETDRQNQITKQKTLLGTQQEAGVREDLAGKLAQAKSGANRRGLLYSGLNQSAQMGLRGGAESQIASGRQQINDASQGQMQQMEAQQAQRGFQQQQQDISKNQAAYRMAWEKKKGDQQNISNTGSAVGGLLGAIF